MSTINNKALESILKKAQDGDELSLEEVLRQYKNIVEIIASKYKNTPMEHEDIVQEGMIGLFSAIKTYNGNRGASFRTYANTCIDNAIQTALRKFKRQKDIPAENMVEYQDEQIDISSASHSAEETYISRERLERITKTFKEIFSDFEYKVYTLYILGCSYDEISTALNTNHKSIDNALQRIKKKLSSLDFE